MNILHYEKPNNNRRGQSRRRSGDTYPPKRNYPGGNRTIARPVGKVTARRQGKRNIRPVAVLRPEIRQSRAQFRGGVQRDRLVTRRPVPVSTAAASR